MNNELTNKTQTSLVSDQREKSDIVIGAPHHAIGGVDELPCNPRRPADENTGFIAKGLADALGASVVIACNATVDPNKSMETEYSKQIISFKPKLLIEIHGHSGKKVPNNIIEVSSGSKEMNIHSELFSSILQTRLGKSEEFRAYTVKGTFENLIFKAAGSVTITNNRWTSIHIELPANLRKDRENNLPKSSKELVAVLAEAVQEFIKDSS